MKARLTSLGLPPLPAQGVHALEREIATTQPDRQTCFAWQQTEIRRWRQQLYLLSARATWPAQWQAEWNGDSTLLLPDGAQLQLRGTPGLRFEQPLQVRARQGGERIVLPGWTHSHQLKHLLQQSDLPPWERTRLPLLWAGKTLLAAGDQIVSAKLDQWLRAHAARLQWRSAAPAN